MASMSKDQLDAIEAEMNQFEMEMRAKMAMTAAKLPPAPKPNNDHMSFMSHENMYVSAPKKLRMGEQTIPPPPPPPPRNPDNYPHTNFVPSNNHPTMIGPHRPQHIPPPPPPPSGMRPTFRPPQLNRPRPPPMPRPPRPPPGIVPSMPPQGMTRSSVPVIPPPRPPANIMGSQGPSNYIPPPRPPPMYRPSGMPPSSNGPSFETVNSTESPIYSSQPIFNDSFTPTIISSSQILYSPALSKKKSKKHKSASSTNTESIEGDMSNEKEKSPPVLDIELPPGTEMSKSSEQNSIFLEKIPPPAIEKIKNDQSNSSKNNPSSKKDKKDKKKKFVRTAAGDIWEDTSLLEWEGDDFRIFAGDLGNEVTDEVLIRAFSRYPSFLKAKVVRDKRSAKTRGYGFISFKDPNDFVRAMREMNGKYVGNRPIKLRKSSWKDRNIDIVKKKEKEKKRLGLR